nr:flavodoxin [uncultured Acetatifactor sp.]
MWHGQAPRIIDIFLESYDFSGKTIVSFCTSPSSGIGSSAANLHALCPDTVEWAEGRRFEAGTSRDAMEEWLSSIGVR